MPDTRPHILVVDAQSLGARAAHVTADPVGGTRLWCQMVRGVALDVGATGLVAAWDHDGPTFRHTLFPAYKYRRTGETRARVAPIRSGVEATGLYSISVAGFEGDDVVASAMALLRAEARVTLLSNDSDLLQFVADGVDVVTYVGAGKGENGTRVKRWTSDDVVKRFGVPPSALAEFKALCGETGDDIPGVANIGKSTAAELLRRWKTLDKALEATAFVGQRDKTAKLAGQHAQVALMLQLTTLRQDVPLPAMSLERTMLRDVTWPDGSTARAAASGVTVRSEAGPGLDDASWPDVPPEWL
ncbi:MAG TPA: 5'-3' exonuclease H3TH domain-containing protein [Gemmatimonas sp.]|nr:5'-3' exonuclease H3TH domain-containing protein [Gemmatimonas sp.]